MSQKHTDLLDQVLDPDSTVLSDDLKLIIHALRNERQTSQLRLEATERLITDHVQACNEQREQMKDLIEVVAALQGTMKFANWMKSFLAWAVGVAGSIYGLYKMWKP